MTRKRWNKASLEAMIIERKIVLDEEYCIPENVIRDTKIKFQCSDKSCDKIGEKTYRMLEKTGSFCISCTSKHSTRKLQNTRQVKFNLENLLNFCTEKEIRLVDIPDEIKRETIITGICKNECKNEWKKNIRSFMENEDTSGLCLDCALEIIQKKSNKTRKQNRQNNEKSFWHKYPNLRSLYMGKEEDLKNFAPCSIKKGLWRCNLDGKCQTTGKKHIFRRTFSDMRRFNGCPYCKSLILCECGCNSAKVFFPYLEEEWDEKQNGPMTQYPKGCNVSVSWICKQDSTHPKWMASLNNRRRSGCPACKYKGEQKLLAFLQKNFPTIIYQAKFYWCQKKIFDYCIEELKIIIELDGKQHFFQVSNWENPEIISSRDIFKTKQAIKNGYTVIRLLQDDVLNDRTNWRDFLKNSCKKYDLIPRIIVSDTKKYEFFLNNMNNG